MGQRADFSAAAVFVQVVESGSIRGAARVLGLPKSNVSRKLAELEERLGARLLQRTTRKLGLTDAGAAYHRHAGVAVSTLIDAERAVADLQGEPRGVLRITAPVNFGNLFLAKLVSDFLQTHPKVEVALELSDRTVDLVEEGFDVAFRAGKLPDSSLIAHRIRGTSLRTVASPGYLAARGTPVSPEDLARHDCLPFGVAREAKWQFRSSRAGKKEIKIRGRFSANSFFVLRDAAILGLGVARLPSFLVLGALRDGRLLPLLDDFALSESPLHLVYPTNLHLASKVRAFIEFVRAAFASPPWLSSQGGDG